MRNGRDPGGDSRIGKRTDSSIRRNGSDILTVFLFPGHQHTRKREGQDAQDAAGNGHRPEKIQSKAGIYQLKISQNQHRWKSNKGQND